MCVSRDIIAGIATHEAARPTCRSRQVQGDAMKKSLSAILCGSLLVSLAFPFAALARDSDVPGWLLGWRDRLLGERSKLLNLRGEVNTRLNILQSYQIKADQMLSGEAQGSPDLIAARDSLRALIKKYQGISDDVELDLMDNNKNLVLVEKDIQAYACWRPR